MTVRRIGLTLFILFLLIPIYWLVMMSFKSNTEITTQLTFFPNHWTLVHYDDIFSSGKWTGSFLHSLSYVVINVAITLPLAIPAAYAFSRYDFLADKHLFFWFLTNLMAPPAVFLIPYFQLYHSIHLFDTVFAVALAHTLFNLPLAVWILEGFMSGVPREIDETAYLDGYSLPRFFIKIFIPLIGSGIGVAAFFCFMFSWIELLLANTLTSSNAMPFATMMSSAFTASGTNWGILAASGTLSIIPGILVIWFVRNRIASGFSLGRV